MQGKGDTDMAERFSLKFVFADAIVIISAILLSVLIFFGVGKALEQQSDVLAVYIYVDGKSLYPDGIPLDPTDGEKTVVISKESFPDYNVKGTVVLTIDGQKGIAVIEADCPNHDCVRQGFVKKSGVPLVCAPNGVAAVIKGNSKSNPKDSSKEDTPDAVIGMVFL